MNSNQPVVLQEPKGLVSDIQKFATHDGPGIRTLVYMKGCPIRCLWCSSPQTQRRALEILHINKNCEKCGRCVKACPLEALTLSKEDGIGIDRSRCDSCGQCVETCLNQAMKLAGKEWTVEELFDEVKKDSPFFRRSKGGVTVGGGEPTMQADFVAAFLKRCKESYIHTIIETCAYARWEQMEKVIQYVDQIYVDIKHIDPAQHKKITGFSNEIILDNVKKAAAIKPMIIRIPVVPGLNDSNENILGTAKFAAELGPNVLRIDLLPYHQFGTQTYTQLGRPYRLADVEPPSASRMAELKQLVEPSGITAQIGG